MNSTLLLAVGLAAGFNGTRPLEFNYLTTVAKSFDGVRPAAPLPSPLPFMDRLVAAGLLPARSAPAAGSRTAVVMAALDVLTRKVEQQSDPNALRLAFAAYYNFKEAHRDKVRNPYLYFVDFGLDSHTPRGYVFDMETLSLVDGPFTVAHGRGSVGDDDSGMPTWFSNRPGSNATSLGLYLTQETYAFRGTSDGAPYRSVGLRLTGVSGRFNSAARSRGIVVHGAPYVTPDKAGRSEGCPAMEPDRAEWLIPRISNGGLVFLFSPLDSQWIREEARVLDDRSQGTLAGLIG
ncbi:hypothetical protein BH23GEM5_BH23GEM5_11530 [soil metagenome]